MATFEVKNDEIATILRTLGRSIKSILPKGWGFSLLIFNYTDQNTDENSLFYISSANRQDVIKAMKEFIERNEN